MSLRLFDFLCRLNNLSLASFGETDDKSLLSSEHMVNLLQMFLSDNQSIILQSAG